MAPALVLRRIGLFVLVFQFTFEAFASVGALQFTFGDVRIRDAAGQTRAVKKGDAINQGDTILTGGGASAQLRMIDGGILAVRPDTELKVDTYRYAGKEDGTENAFMSLVKGGFRTITGAIGRTNKDNYRIGTPSATIGIRGTDHEPLFVPPVTTGTQPVPPGTYDKVNVGIAFIRTPLGEVNIRQNQVGFVAPGQIPTILPVIPDIFKATPPVRAARQQEQKEAEKQQVAQNQTAAREEPATQEKKPAAVSDGASATSASRVAVTDGAGKSTVAPETGVSALADTRSAVVSNKGGQADNISVSVSPAAAGITPASKNSAAQTVEQPITVKLNDAENFGLDLTSQKLISTGSNSSKRDVAFADEALSAANQAESAKGAAASVLSAGKAAQGLLNSVISGSSGLKKDDVDEINRGVNNALSLAKEGEALITNASSRSNVAAAAAKKAEETGDLRSLISAQTELKTAKAELEEAQGKLARSATEWTRAIELAERVQGSSGSEKPDTAKPDTTKPDTTKPDTTKTALETELSKAKNKANDAVDSVGKVAEATTRANQTIAEGKKPDDKDKGKKDSSDKDSGKDKTRGILLKAATEVGVQAARSVADNGCGQAVCNASSGTVVRTLDGGGTMGRWGRWGAERLNESSVPSGESDGLGGLIARIARSVFGGMESGPVVLPVTGTATYQLVGASSPVAFTPSRSGPDVGKLGSAMLAVNFTAKTVDVSVNASTPASGNWSANANGVPIVRDTTFAVHKALDGAGNLAVTRNGSADNTAGSIVGAFKGATGGSAGLGYVLNQNGPAGVTLTGVAVFKRP